MGDVCARGTGKEAPNGQFLYLLGVMDVLSVIYLVSVVLVALQTNDMAEVPGR